jgi:uncharacterized protein (DUF1330 family)
LNYSAADGWMPRRHRSMRGAIPANFARKFAKNLLPEEMMPKAYWIVHVSVHDPEHYPEYLTAAIPVFEKFGANFIVRGGAYEVMEGTERERNFVIEFKDRATAMACYKSPEYQAAVAIRNKYSVADLIIIDGPA